MNYISYEEACNISLEWDNTKPLTVISFVDGECESCTDLEELVLPVLKECGITHYEVDLRKNKVPFPPNSTPTLYWFFAKDFPPLIRKGVPPNKSLLVEFLNKAIEVYNGTKTVEENFF